MLKQSKISASSASSPLRRGREERSLCEASQNSNSTLKLNYYNPTLSIWSSVDPMSDKYPSMSAYMYCAGNPVVLVDPDGREIDDYFNQNGIFLGSDDAETDFVKIIDQDVWDSQKTINPDGTESIDHNIGFEYSTSFSNTETSTDASLNVYQHYNPTDLKLINLKDRAKGGMTFLYNNKSAPKIGVKIDANRVTGLCNQASQIINVFIHEKQHYDDYTLLGFDKYKALNLSWKEQRAIITQMNHESYIKTSEKFKRNTIQYGERYGLVRLMPMKNTGF